VPWYRFGHAIVLAYIGIGWISSFIFTILLRRENARRDRGEVIDGVDSKYANEANGRWRQ